MTEQTADEPRTEFTVPLANLAALRAKIAQLNRRAGRLHCPPIQLTIGPEFIAEKAQEVIETSRLMAKSRRIKVKCVTVTVTGERPKLPGWALVARVQLLDGVTLLHTVPGESAPREYHTVTNRCDHCGTIRTRNDIFVLRNEHRHIVVGRTCIADFLGGITPAQLAWYAESLHALDLREFEDWGGSGGVAADLDVERYLVCAATAIRLGGWIAKGAVQYSGGPCTASWAAALYWGRLYFDGKDLADSPKGRGSEAFTRVETTEADEAEAASAIAWASAIDPETANDYLINCHKVASLSYVPWNLSGITASIVSAHQREQSRLAVHERAKAVSQHIGEVGKRLTLDLTVERIISVDGQYGTTHIHMFRDTAGNVVKWFASRECLSEGKTYSLKATIKNHGEYKGIAETIVTRAAVLEGA